jgi:hypothetical protein
MRWAKSGAEAAARLAAPELADGWAKPASLPAEVWRERAFEVVFDGGRGTGVFDRVVVERDGSGRAGRAPVFDSGTERVERGAIWARRPRGMQAGGNFIGGWWPGSREWSRGGRARGGIHAGAASRGGHILRAAAVQPEVTAKFGLYSAGRAPHVAPSYLWAISKRNVV